MSWKAQVKLNPMQREIVGKTIESLRDQKTWCRGTHARDAYSSEVSWDSPEATSFCATGRMLSHAHSAGISTSHADFVSFGISDIFFMRFGKRVTHVNDFEGRASIIEKLTELHDLAKE